MFKAIQHPSRYAYGHGFAVKYIGPANSKPSWTPTGIFGWYKFKRNAQAAAKVLNEAESKKS